MGFVIPRPAIRSRENRIIHARLKFHQARMNALIAEGMDRDKASAQAAKEARTQIKS